jgi:hypothetical protein
MADRRRATRRNRPANRGDLPIEHRIDIWQPQICEADYTGANLGLAAAPIVLLGNRPDELGFTDQAHFLGTAGIRVTRACGSDIGDATQRERLAGLLYLILTRLSPIRHYFSIARPGLEAVVQTLFSTNIDHPRDRFDYWHNVSSKILVDHDFQT